MEEDRYLRPGEAALIAYRLYAGRMDLMGRPEIVHIQWVAEHCSEQAKVAAWLHDAIEDRLIDYKVLIEEHKLSPEDYGALVLLTRPHEMEYRQYIRRIANALGPSGVIAREVKSVDLNHNRIRPCPPTMASMRAPAGRYSRAQRDIRHAQEQHGEQITGMEDRALAVAAGIDPIAFPA